MFSFFTKKQYLVDFLDGFVDIHNHILPGIDDGAKTVEDSIALIKAFYEFGVKHFIATPHIMGDYHLNTPKTINDALALLKNELIQKEMNDISISAAAEHMIDERFETLLNEDQVMPLSGSYLLIEMSFLQPPINFENAIQEIKKKDLFPILAHPERYSFLQPYLEKYKNHKNQGLLFQMNMLSLSNYYGNEVRNTANQLLNKGLIDFMGSDVHNKHQIDTLKSIKVSKKQVDLLNPILERTKNNFG